jgi:microcystin-dependent protein
MNFFLNITLLVLVLNTSAIQAQDDALKITEQGNIGINTATPSEKLEVNGNIKVVGNINTNGSIQQNGNDLLPKGAIIMWYGTTIPLGWVICDGNNGTPDLRGRFIVGVNGNDYKLKDTGGEKTVTLSVEQMPKHSHVLESESGAHNNEQGWPVGGFKAVYSTDRIGAKSSEPVHPTGGDKPHENRPPYDALYYIMKL